MNGWLRKHNMMRDESVPTLRHIPYLFLYGNIRVQEQAARARRRRRVEKDLLRRALTRPFPPQSSIQFRRHSDLGLLRRQRRGQCHILNAMSNEVFYVVGGSKVRIY